ncbi:GAP family protein [Streptomyces sp. NPDC021056]|uniref:GAP family protein n=1 Tax=Streptomyces sp. NPDC021056 TaxID=3155012 RepID=UPI0033C2A1B8
MAPPRHPRLRRPRFLHPATTGTRPKRRRAGLSLYQVVRDLQTLLATWTGACPTCHRDIPTPLRTCPSPTRRRWTVTVEARPRRPGGMPPSPLDSPVRRAVLAARRRPREAVGRFVGEGGADVGEAIGGMPASAVGVAISPLPLIAMILMLAAPEGRGNGLAFTAGWVAGLAAVVTVVVLFGSDGNGDGGEPPTWVAWLKLASACCSYSWPSSSRTAGLAPGARPDSPAGCGPSTGSRRARPRDSPSFWSSPTEEPRPRRRRRRLDRHRGRRRGREDGGHVGVIRLLWGIRKLRQVTSGGRS